MSHQKRNDQDDIFTHIPLSPSVIMIMVTNYIFQGRVQTIPPESSLPEIGEHLRLAEAIFMCTWIPSP